MDARGFRVRTSDLLEGDATLGPPPDFTRTGAPHLFVSLTRFCVLGVGVDADVALLDEAERGEVPERAWGHIDDDSKEHEHCRGIGMGVFGKEGV